MPNRRSLHLVCFHCAVAITEDEQAHYGHQCHACVMHEHDLEHLSRRDPHHPDLAWLDRVPVDTGHPRTQRQSVVRLRLVSAA